MKIAMLAPFEESVPPKRYGGTELVIFNLIEELVKIGHEVELIGVGDSITSAKLVTIFEKSLRQNIKSELLDIYKFIGIGKILEYLSINNFDIIHNHIGWRFIPFIKLAKPPVVTTLHGPLTNTVHIDLYSKYLTENYISISHNQRKGFPKLNFVGNVYNGIDFSRFKLNKNPKDYIAFLGRMSPEKGPEKAIEVARATGQNLIMAAKVDKIDKEFFDQKVKPWVDGKQIKFIGEVDHKGKIDLLGNAKALIAPIQWDEPFGLYFIEAMACGAPVLTLDRGSVREIIIDQKTGFICKDLNEMIEKINSINKINRQDCYTHSKENFSSEEMAENYCRVYKKVIAESL